MLELRPSCEQCDRDLPPDAVEARICTYECTFCAPCVDGPLAGVCPNCGGGFVPRPVRPRIAWRDGVSLAHQPASATRVHRPVDLERHAQLVRRAGATPPAER